SVSRSSFSSAGIRPTGRSSIRSSIRAPVPEIDPATGGSAFLLVAGVLAVIEQRRRRATLVA
ncbi:MAG: hypothetical protein WCO67_27005, partial [Betaproteobacteria bacterium]